jgi:hypothetical protein
MCGFLVLLVGLLVYHYDRHLARKKLKKRSQHLRRVKSTILLDKEKAKDAILRIENMVTRLDFKFAPVKRLHREAILETQAAIVQTFTDLDLEELNYVLTNLQLPHIVYLVKDVAPFTHRSDLLRLMAETRLDELGTSARACVLDAIQHIRLSSHPYAPNWVENIITNTHGEDLTRLKTRLDSKGDIENMHKLVWQDLGDSDCRRRVLQHLREEAEQKYSTASRSPCNSISLDSSIRGSMDGYNSPRSDDGLLMASPEGSPVMHNRSLDLLDVRVATDDSTSSRFGAFPVPRIVPIKILSDVDDTLYSSGGNFPAGICMKYDKHVLYPGVLTFYKEIDIGLGPYRDTGEWPRAQVGNLAFISARPHLYKDVSEQKSYDLFHRLVKTRRMHSMPTLLPGSLASGVSMFANDYYPMAVKKFANFNEYALCYPECAFVFVGDNGQADVWAGEMMKEHFGDAVKAIFIHKVQPVDLTPGFQRLKPDLATDTVGPHWERYWHEDPLTRYAHMGIIFFDTYVGAVTKAAALGLVHPKAVQRVAKAAKKELLALDMERVAKEERRRELNADLRLANEFLRDAKVGQVELLDSDARFRPGSYVDTSSGPGKVAEFRNSEGVYEVTLFSPDFNGSNVAVQPEDALHWACAAQPGTRVLTPQGVGSLVEVRKLDGLHVVRLVRPIEYSEQESRNWQKMLLGNKDVDVYQQKGHTVQVHYDGIQVIKAAPGDYVDTLQGNGVVELFRPETNDFIVILATSASSPAQADFSRSWFDGLPRVVVSPEAITSVSSMKSVEQRGSSRCAIS